MKNILVTGGAGYIGSITARELQKAGFNPVIFDSMEKGHSQAVDGLDLVQGRVQDKELLKQVFKQKNISGVIHFAAYIEMGESMLDPYRYFSNNFFGSLELFQAMAESNVKSVVFSSTAGVYGMPDVNPITEDAVKNPVNPYGQSKLMTEQALQWWHQIHRLNFISLRYFNAAGATLDGRLGESHQPESHLIPNLIYSILNNTEFGLYGHDYNTPDGTCIRDYIHVLDLAQYHILALKYLFAGGKSLAINAGTGSGYSNLEVIKAVEQVTGKTVKVRQMPRRPGDADRLVADNRKIVELFKYQPKYSDLPTVIKSAWAWHQHQKY